MRKIFIGNGTDIIFVETYKGLIIAQRRRSNYFFVLEYPASSFVSVKIARKSIDNLIKRQGE